MKVKFDGTWTSAKDRRPGRDERSSEVSKFVEAMHNKRNSVPSCFHEVHALYLHGVPSQSIPAAPSVLLLWPPCHAVILPSERPLIRPEKCFVEPLTAFRQEHLCVALILAPEP